MTTPLSVLALLTQHTKAGILDLALGAARIVGLPVETWRVGDPTRTQYVAQAEILEAFDQQRVKLAESSFLSTATGDWLKLRAQDVYGVEVEEAAFATSTVTLDNAGGGLFELDPGGLVVSNSTTGATYTNQSTITIDPLTSGIEVSVVAQTAGSAGTSAEDEIDTIVSPALAEVTITASTAAIGADEQSEQGIRDQCLATLGALSPDGPADAYEYVARSEELTGVAGVTRALADGDNTTGTVTLYVATTTAALDGASITAIQAAVDEWATPLCTDCTVTAATPQTIAVTLTGVGSANATLVGQTLDAFFAGIELGGYIARDAITSAVRVALTNAGASFGPAIVCTLPASDVDLAADRFPVKGSVSLP